MADATLRNANRATTRAETIKQNARPATIERLENAVAYPAPSLLVLVGHCTSRTLGPLRMHAPILERPGDESVG
eukprot:6634351-Lingulodinium_polyedra.AAC.1